MRFLPYSTRPGRLLAQLFSDIAVAIWTTTWVFVGLAVHAAVATIAEVGRQVKNGADGISDNLNSAGDSAHRIPLVGDKVGAPLRAASEAAADLAGAATIWTPPPAGWPSFWRSPSPLRPSWPSQVRGSFCASGFSAAS
ncbi:transmembrane protein [Mycobacteroides abscessus]|nr:transmembrane protein [Mycobacteroides abscessus]